MRTVLDEARLRALTAPLDAGAAQGPLAPPPARPFHVLYGGAHRFSRDTPEKLARLARRAFDEHAPDPAALVALCGLPIGGASELAARVHARVARKLDVAPIEDLRIDFEDGYGPHGDDDEDREAVRAGSELVAMDADALPPFVGIRVKAMRQTARRALRTLDLFLGAAAERIASLPSFVVTLPKVEHPDEVRALCDALGELERGHGLAEGHVGVEVMIESPRGLVTPGGRLGVGALVDAGRRPEDSGRVRSVHFGTYDFLGALSVTAPHQDADHPAAALARQLLQLSLAGSDVTLSDGATHLMPIGPHRAPKEGALEAKAREENRAIVAHALTVHARGIRRALTSGIYCGWDLHPTQLVARWAAVIAFFLEDLEAQTARMASYLERARAADRVGAMFDDAASAQGLFHTFLRGHAAGALDDEDLRRAGLDR